MREFPHFMATNHYARAGGEISSQMRKLQDCYYFQELEPKLASADCYKRTHLVGDAILMAIFESS